jgi:hypothetical protein
MVQHLLAPYTLKPGNNRRVPDEENVVTSRYAVQPAEKVGSNHDSSDFCAGGAMFES